MDLKIKLDIPSHSYITVTPIQSLDPHTALYTVKGVELGATRLMFTALAQHGALITNDIENIQVRLELHRGTITLYKVFITHVVMYCN